MSVINKMLRDLDRQKAAPVAVGTAPPRALGTGLTDGTSVVHGSASLRGGGGQADRTRRWMVPMALILLLMLVVGWSLRAWLTPASPAPGQSTTPVAQTTAPAQTLSARPEPALADAQDDSKKIAAAADGKTATAQKSIQELPKSAIKVEPDARANATATAVAVVPVAKDAKTKPVPIGQGSGLKETTELKTFGLAMRPAPAAKAVAASQLPQAPAGLTVSEQQAALNVVAQAQAHWNEGDRAGAIALLQGAMARMESGSGAPAALATLAREYVRMTQVQGRPQDALNMLVNLESRLAGVADIWALRGHVAQGLGLHPQAVHAYLKALELKPGEPRWMLAVAVSLAAQGQTGSAAEFAEKARRAGFLQPDVANYLRQLGVPLRAD